MKTKILENITVPRLLAGLGLAVLVFLSTLRPLGAQQVTQGYRADKPIERGMIVRLSDEDNNKVEPVKDSDEAFMHGVVVDPNDAPISLSSDDSQVFVATSGRYEVLVNTQKGTIQAGDYLTVSSTDGVATKAEDSDSHVIGKAVMGFDGSQALGSSEVSGRTVQYGRLLSDIAVNANPNFKKRSSLLPDFLTRSANSIGGKEVSPGKIYVAMLIITAATIITVSLIYGGIRSSITAIGRNPLAKASVNKSLGKVIIMGFIIFASGLFGVYLLLKL